MTVFNLLVGLGIFLYGINQLEGALRQLGRYRLQRLFSPIGTGSDDDRLHAWQSVILGVITTALLQSSSMVSLIVQALASAGLMPLVNGVGVILGANLGTTLTGWLVAVLGFKLSLDELSTPLLGIACLGLFFYPRSRQSQGWFTVLLGLGLLLFGLGQMKTSVEYLPNHFPVEALKELPPLAFLLLGAALTAVIQSSSATMMIALTALNSGMLDLSAAAALVIGADLGTTSTSALASIRGSAIKKQLALAHILFNLVVDISAFVLLLPFLPELLALLGLQDPLFSLVAFHSLFNLIGLSVFIPFINPFAHWLETLFLDTDSPRYPNLAEIPMAEPEAVLAAIQHTARLLVSDAVTLNQLSLPITRADDTEELSREDFESRYEALKSTEGRLLICARDLQQQPLETSQTQRLNRWVGSAREAILSVRSIKGLRDNLERLSEGELGHYQKSFQKGLDKLYRPINPVVSGNHNSEYIRECLQQMDQDNTHLHETMHTDIIHLFKDVRQNLIEPLQRLRGDR